MALSKADVALMREMASVLIEFAVRIEVQSVLNRDERTEELLARADRCLFEAWERIEPVQF